MTRRELRTKVAEAALSLAQDHAWSEITLPAIADHSGLSLADFHGEIRQDSLLDLIDSVLDHACASEPADPDVSVRERIFESAMLRFEAMEAHRAALLKIRKTWKNRPLARLDAARRRVRTAAWVLTCARLTSAPPPGSEIILSGILFRAEEAWEKETSTDFTRTMAQLDRDLRDVDGLIGRLPRFGRPRRHGPSKPAQNETPVSS